MAYVFNVLATYFEFSFVKYSFIVGVLISLCAALLGVILVLKKFSFIGDGLSHIAFGALAIATILKINSDMVIVMPITITSAFVLLSVNNYCKKIEGDALLAMISVGAIAVGYILLNIFPSSSNISADVCGTLFGSTSIMTLTISDVWICSVMSIVVITLFVIFYNKILAVTYDEAFASATGVKVNVYNNVISIICAVIVVLSMNLVGSLLISALIVFPAVSAMQIFKSFRSVVISTAIISVFCAILGMLVSLLISTPIGATIVVADILVFLVISIVSKVCKQ